MSRRKVENGKLIDTYNVAVEGGAVGYKVQLHMVTHYQWGVSFVAICDTFGLRCEGKDVDQLKRDMKLAIADKAAFTWEPYLEINITDFVESGPDALFGDATTRARMTLAIDVTRLEFATKDGKKFHRSARSVLTAEGWPTPRKRHNSCSVNGTTIGNDMTSTSIVRDTPETRAALLKIKVGLAALVEQLSTALSQGQIEQTLRAMLLGGGNVLALPAPAVASKSKARSRR